MQKLFKNEYMEIVVRRDVVLNGERFRRAENLTAQATDRNHSTWHICRALGSSVCVVDRSELEQRKEEGLISYEWA